MGNALQNAVNMVKKAAELAKDMYKKANWQKQPKKNV
jgi:hypothetical protein